MRLSASNDHDFTELDGQKKFSSTLIWAKWESISVEMSPKSAMAHWVTLCLMLTDQNKLSLPPSGEVNFSSSNPISKDYLWWENGYKIIICVIENFSCTLWNFVFKYWFRMTLTWFKLNILIFFLFLMSRMVYMYILILCKNLKVKY